MWIITRIKYDFIKYLLGSAIHNVSYDKLFDGTHFHTEVKKIISLEISTFYTKLCEVYKPTLDLGIYTYLYRMLLKQILTFMIENLRTCSH